MTLAEAQALLGIGATDNDEEIRRAYRDLAKVWHPDRFQDDPRLRAKADAELKRVNAAYELVRAARERRQQDHADPPCAWPEPARSPEPASGIGGHGARQVAVSPEGPEPAATADSTTSRPDVPQRATAPAPWPMRVGAFIAAFARRFYEAESRSALVAARIPVSRMSRDEQRTLAQLAAPARAYHLGGGNWVSVVRADSPQEAAHAANRLGLALQERIRRYLQDIVDAGPG